ncbi:MAG: hypothetical protein PHO30_02630, partial [Candidatus Omnitrophica bacterium]|nr:hypothetical protein [Candidatus Omnitrophota bacterium]
SRDNPYFLEVRGKISKDSATGDVIFDFSDFGQFRCQASGEYSVSGYWMPITHHPLDSLEDYTNRIVLKLSI